MTQPIPTWRSKDKRVRDFQEVSLGYPRKTATEESRRCPQCPEPVCMSGCPLGIDIPGFIRLMREGDVGAALDKIKEQNPFPSICGRVCPAPCEKACVFEKDGSPIGVRALERFAADNGRSRGGKRREKSLGKKVAIIGSGPSGLTVAQNLARVGYLVTVFDALPLPGGILRYGIPDFRLPSQILDKEIGEMRAAGVDFRTSTSIGHVLTVEELFVQGFAAVVLAVGQGTPMFRDLPGAHLDGVLYAEEVLVRTNFIKEGMFKKAASAPGIGKRVAVLGSGPAALDIARVCVRLGRPATMVFDGTEEELMVHPADREQAREEGVRFEAMARPVEIVEGGEHRVEGLRCSRLDYADPSGEGKWRLLVVPDSGFGLDVDTVIFASGRSHEHRAERLVKGIRTNTDGSVWTDGETGMTSVPKIFACGDAADSGGTIVTAMASGKMTAAAVDKYLKGYR